MKGFLWLPYFLVTQKPTLERGSMKKVLFILASIDNFLSLPLCRIWPNCFRHKLSNMERHLSANPVVDDVVSLKIQIRNVS